MVPPKNTSVTEGSRAKLVCQAEGFPNNITYHWFKGRQSVQEVPNFGGKYGIYADGSLIISTALKEHAGWYSCRPSNGLGPPPEASAYLNITCEYIRSTCTSDEIDGIIVHSTLYHNVWFIMMHWCNVPSDR